MGDNKTEEKSNKKDSEKSGKAKKFIKSILLLTIILCVLSLLAYGGIFALKAIKKDAQKPTALQDSPAQKHTLTAIPTPKSEIDVIDNLAYAITKNQDSVCWLEVPNTQINNIVMQGDDNDFYLRRDENKEHDVYGCYFLDYECALGKREDFSQNTVIYGHSEMTDNKDGKRFAQLFKFVDDDFAKNTPYIFLTTPNQKFVFEIFSTFYTSTSFDYIKVNITDKEKLLLANEAKRLSIRDYKIEPTLEDKLLTLSTCSVKQPGGDYRFCVMARLVGQEKTDEILAKLENTQKDENKKASGE